MNRLTPIDLGHRLPAEWEPHQATWLAWPHNESDWPGKLQSIEWAYTEIVKKVTAGERVRLIVNDEKQKSRALACLNKTSVDIKQVEFYTFPTNRSWTRDFCPFFLLTKNGEVAFSRFQFNAWAKYPDWQKDTLIPDQIAKCFNYNVFHANEKEAPVVLEGGAVDGNGKGTLLTTEECLLDKKVQVRNPKLDKKDVETVFKKFLSIEQTLWLNRGIAGDDTHGHIDDFCRFVNPNTVVLCEEKNGRDPNHAVLEENRERLEGQKLHTGESLETIRLPMPAPLYFDNCRLPASYGNFYITNSAVLVPTFNDPNDSKALGILSEVFPDRSVIGIHAVDLVWGFGTLHCLTHEEPKP